MRSATFCIDRLGVRRMPRTDPLHRPAAPEHRHRGEGMFDRGKGGFALFQTRDFGPDVGEFFGQGKLGQDHSGPPLFCTLRLPAESERTFKGEA